MLSSPPKPTSPAVIEQKILWRPSPRQEALLAAPEKEVLFGGAAGGGKSDSLLIDALGLHQGAIYESDYQALLIRRTYPDLKDLIERSHAIYPLFGGKYDKQDHVWRFPGGARIEFGHIQHPQDRFKYRGRAFAYIGWDELTLFPTDVAYVYLLSRLRSVNPKIRCYVRSTTNPDGPGFRWVKLRWSIPKEGTETRQRIEVTDPETGRLSEYFRRFIPSKLSDNPYLNDSGYRETLLMLPEEERNALLLGQWDQIAVRGAYYAEALIRARNEGRVGNVPHVPGVVVNTLWDIGLDATSIWFHQRVAMQDRFIRAYENSNQQIDFYIAFLREMQDKHKYVYGMHYLPHDAKQNRVTSKSFEALFREAGIQNIKVVDVSKDVDADIAATLRAFPAFCFDETECADGLAAIENYRQEWDEKLQTYAGKPKHDWASHYADALRQFAQGYNGQATPQAIAPVRQIPRSTGWSA